MSVNDASIARAETSKRVLVIDDEPRSVAGVIMELRLRGIQVDHAKTKQAAVGYLSRNAYDALLLDLMLPERETGELKTDPPSSQLGFGLLDTIRRGDYEPEGTKRHVPIVALTGVGARVKEVAGQLRMSAIDHVFVKPETPVLLAETIVGTIHGY